jgi:hypothetical protein
MKDFTATNAEFESIDISEKFQVSESGAIGGVIPSGINDIIKWDGSQWIAGINPGGNGGGGGGSGVADPFTTNLISGQSLQNISFNQTLDSAPSIATDLEIDGDGSIIPYTISGLSTTGYTAIFAEEIPNNNYKIHTVFGGGSSSGGSELSGEELRAINKTIVDSPVDVFVYDTSRDSDGGAWRKRTQHTSWYNEELNTATRGARREFPAVAVIVAETDKVTIYDGDDPDLSMWMVFESGNGNDYFLGGANFTAISILNGKLICASNGGARECDFISEYMFQRKSSLVDTKVYLGYISNRNGGLNRVQTSVSSSELIVNESINDVAMTVLPNAPIDEDTGLPVPTIAVATDGGVSVIKDDGNVVDITSGQTSFLHSYYVVFDQSNRLFLSLDGQGLKRRIWGLNNIPATDLVITTDINEKQNGDIFIADNNGYGTTTKDMFLFNQSNSQAEGFASDNSIGTNQGLFKSFINKEDSSKSLYNYITSKYNTGWMPGDIKLTALSDSVVENVGVSSDELISNNKFGTGTEPTGWLTHLGTSTIVNNQAVLDGSGVTDANLITEINCVVGKMYEFNIDSFRSAGSNTYDISVSTGSGSLFHQSVIKGVNKNNTSIETTTIRFVATQATHYVGVKCNGSPSNAVITIDNAYARQITELITNGDFSTDSDWDKSGHWTISAGTAVMSSTSEYKPLYQYDLNMIQGKKYVATINVSDITGEIKFDTAKIDGNSITNSDGIVISSTGIHSLTFVAESDQDGIGVARNTTIIPSSCTINSISVRPAVEDRSVNNNGLQIVGEINKTPVASGADLVAYSGFSAKNYLVQPYNADLNFTDTMSIMLWVKDVTGSFNPIDRGTRGVDHSYGLYLKDAGGDIRFYYSVNGTTDLRVEIAGGASLIQSGWHHVAVCVSQGKIKMYVDGKLLKTADQEGNFYSQSINQNGLRVGRGSINSASWEDHLLAALRISATAPTDEQIAKIYRDEKVLFQDGAQATLYGTGDAVTALAYDQKTELLHVGTASGRSDFRGLARVNNTTTAISNSISAAEGTIIQN